MVVTAHLKTLHNAKYNCLTKAAKPACNEAPPTLIGIFWLELCNWVAQTGIESLEESEQVIWILDININCEGKRKELARIGRIYPHPKVPSRARANASREMTTQTQHQISPQISPLSGVPRYSNSNLFSLAKSCLNNICFL